MIKVGKKKRLRIYRKGRIIQGLQWFLNNLSIFNKVYTFEFFLKIRGPVCSWETPIFCLPNQFSIFCGIYGWICKTFINILTFTGLFKNNIQKWSAITLKSSTMPKLQHVSESILLARNSIYRRQFARIRTKRFKGKKKS